MTTPKNKDRSTPHSAVLLSIPFGQCSIKKAPPKGGVP